MQVQSRWFKNLRSLSCSITIFLLLMSVLSMKASAATISKSSAGITVTVDPNGRYDIAVSNPAWTFGGNIGRPLTNIAVTTGTDNVGDYDETSFDYSVGASAADDSSRHAGIRAYHIKPVVLFTLQYLNEASNTEPFPVLQTYPQDLFHLTYRGIFGHYDFSQFGTDSSWTFFDASANTFILSPASDFMIAKTAFGPSQEIFSGIDGRIASLPQGFTHQTLLTVGNGINSTFEIWGRAMTDLQGKVRPASDADVSLAYLGYWTDNGAVYYYNFKPELGYEGTLLAVRDEFANKGIPLGYMQIDSWFYPKGAAADWRDHGGIYQYVADPSLFADGLDGFQQQLGLPLVTHARWIDPASPYRQQYQISGNVSVDPQYWDDIIGYLKSAGVVTYEQDWLGAQAQTAFNLNDPDAFMNNMARANLENGLTMQYCMALPRHYLQTSKYDNITTIRTSDDRFERRKWDSFLYASRLASALGVWPWSDVFMSSELENLLISNLSAGPVGVGDRVGALNKSNLLRVVRNDAVIVKPDVPLAPLDQSFLNDAQGLQSPMVAATYSDLGGMKAFYVFAYNRGSDTTAVFTPSSLGLTGSVFVYNYFTNVGTRINATDTFSEDMTSGRAYYILVPIGQSEIAFLGDAGQFVSLGQKRIIQVADDGTLQATIAFASGEAFRTIHGYSATAPVVTAIKGAAGLPTYDPTSQLFTVDVSPDADGVAIIAMNPS